MKGEAAKPLSRLEKQRKDRSDPFWEPDMPEVLAGGHLVGYLFAAGPSLPGAMGPVPLTHTEIASWQASFGLELSSWEAQTLRELSMAYVAMSLDAKDVNCPSPAAAPVLDDEDRAIISDKVHSIFGGLMASRNQRKPSP